MYFKFPGVACFVDVKTNKQDCSSSVALELLSMGASVEKTLNKKVKMQLVMFNLNYTPYIKSFLVVLTFFTSSE